jgi:thiol-disulfide isomerase/thioredoxin
MASDPIPKEYFEELKGTVNLQDGDLLYVDFWASWCIPCRKSFPWMNAMQARYKEKNFKVLAVNLDKDKALAEKFLEKVPADFPIFYDPEAKFAKLFKVVGMPSSYLVDSNGKVLRSHKGFFEKKKEEYEQEIKSLLAN